MLRRKKLGIQEDSSESPVIREGFNKILKFVAPGTGRLRGNAPGRRWSP